MKVIDTTIKDLKVLEFPKFCDDRGYFFESYNKDAFQKCGINDEFVQDNISASKQNVVRGMHGQINPNQAKLVRCLHGEIYDIVIDIRENSNTFLQHYGVKLTKENNLAFLVPHGFLHGFSVISNEDAIVMYKTTGVYNKNGEYGVNPIMKNIDWMVENQIISDRDLASQSLDNFIKSDIFQKIQQSLVNKLI